MGSRTERLRLGLELRRQVHGLLLALGMVGLLGLLFADLRISLRAGAVAVLGDDGAGRLTPLTQGRAMDGFGAWSPDGKRIAFMRDGQILLTDPAGKRAKPLTSQSQQWDAAPAWRSDGKAIAFVRTAMQGDQSRVMLVEPGSSDPARAIAAEPGQIGYVAWSPDGKALYYSTRQRIVRVAVGGGRAVTLYSLPETWEALSGGLAVSPDGKQILFGAGPRTERGVDYELWQLDATGGKPVQLTREGGIMPAFDPTGQRVAYRNPRQQTGIYTINLVTGDRKQLVADEPKAMFFHPAFSPDGKRLLISRLLLDAEPRNGQGFTSHLYLRNLREE